MNRPSLVTIILALATTICVLVGYTVSVEITKSTSITAKNVTTEKTKGTILYDVNVNDTKGSALKEIVVQIDQTPVDAINNEQKASRPPVSGNATSENSTSVNITLGYSTPVGQNISVVIKTTTKATNLAVVETSPKTNVTITSTTTELISTNLQPKTASTAEVVRFISNKYCYCDQIYGICDVNCCCDTDCSNYDLKAFTLCSDQTKSNSIKHESILFDSSLFYVVIDNVPSDYFYPERDAIKSELQVEASLRNRNIFTWHGEKVSRHPSSLLHTSREDLLSFNSYDLTYKSIRWMYTVVSNIVNSSEIKTFGLKNSAFNSLCAVEEPVEYLQSKETICQIFVPNLTEVCNNDSSLSFKHYFGEKEIFKVVQPIYNSVKKTEKFSLVTVQATVHHHCILANGSSYDCHMDLQRNTSNSNTRQHYHPIYSAGICRRTVETVKYSLTHNGTRGVQKVDIYFYYRDVSDIRKPVYLSQKFFVKFYRVAAVISKAEIFERSGKPGYLTGLPLLVTGGKKDVSNQRVPKQMDFPKPDGYGMCSVRQRQPVNFVENLDVWCHARIQLHQRRLKRTEEFTTTALIELCHTIQNETLQSLRDYEGISVASLGDPDMARWIPIVVIKPLTTTESSTSSDELTCTAIINKIHVQVLYSHISTVDSPQATVLGVLVNYTTTNIVITNNTETVEIPLRASVVFVDLTRPPIRTFAEPPTYEFRLPEDFYYPFWSSTSSINEGTTTGYASHLLLSKFDLLLLSLITLYYYS